MKSKGTTHRKSFIKRLLSESLILSCLGKLSSRLISFFKASVMSYVLTGAATSDEALKNGGLGRAAEKQRLKTRFAKNVKLRFALSVENSAISRSYRESVNRVMHSPVRTFGVFTATLGVYICLVYFVKLYGFSSLRPAGLGSLFTGCVMIAASVPLLLCRKSLACALEKSAFVHSLLTGITDLGVYGGERRSGGVGIALMTGSFLGALTFFCGEKRILLLIAGALYLLVVLYSPEMGLLSAVALFPFCRAEWVCAILTAALISYVIKVLRGKRNLRFGTANVFMLLLCLCFLFELFGGGKNALFAFCMAALYLLTANLFTTRTLLNKGVNALTLGLGVAVVVYAAQVFTAASAGAGWKQTLIDSHSVFGTGRQFSAYLLLVLPFLFCKAQGGAFFSKLYGYLLAAACIVYSVLNGNTAYAVLTAAAAALFLAVQGRKLFRPFLLCFGLPVCGLYFAAVPISFGEMGFYTLLSGWAAAFKAGVHNFLLGSGMSAASSALAFWGDSHSFYLQIFVECGFLGFLLLALAVCFALQQTYSQLSEVGSENRSVTAAAGASALVGLILGMGTNLWADKDLCFIFWFSLGLAGAAYEIRMERRRGAENERDR